MRVADVFNSRPTRLELSDGSMLAGGDVRRGFALTDYERSLAESGAVLVRNEREAEEPAAETTPGGDGQ